MSAVARKQVEAADSVPAPIVARGAMDLSMVMDPDVLDTRQAKKEWDTMSEPSSAAATAGGTIALGLTLSGLATAIVIVAAFLATIVVLCMTRPRTTREWSTGIVSTLVSSLAGGAYLVAKLGLHQNLPSDMPSLVLALMVMGGCFFVAGLPGWAIVRWLFNYFDAKKDATIVDVARDVKSVTPLS